MRSRKRGVAQPGIDDRMNRADAGAGQHGHRAFDRQRHVDDDAIALHHSERFQAIGEAADHAVQLAIGDDAFAAILAKPDESGAIAALGVRMAIQRIHRDVGLRTGEPLMMDAIPLEDAIPFLCP